MCAKFLRSENWFMALKSVGEKFLRSVNSFVALRDRARKVLQVRKVICSTYGDLKNSAQKLLYVPWFDSQTLKLCAKSLESASWGAPKSHLRNAYLQKFSWGDSHGRYLPMPKLILWIRPCVLYYGNINTCDKSGQQKGIFHH